MCAKRAQAERQPLSGWLVLSNRESSRCEFAIRTHTRVNCTGRGISLLLHTTALALYLALEIERGSARDGDETRWNRPRLSRDLYTPFSSLIFSPLSPSCSPQLGLISTRKREIAIGAGERVWSNTARQQSSIFSFSLSFCLSLSLCSTFHKIAGSSLDCVWLFLLSFSRASIGTGLISMSSTLWVYIQCGYKRMGDSRRVK